MRIARRIALENLLNTSSRKFNFVSQAKLMQIKSWQIPILGIIAQAIVSMVWLKVEIWNAVEMGSGIIFVGLYILILLVFGIIASLLLYFEKTRKAGAIISIILGVLDIMPFNLLTFAIGGILKIFLLIAGIYYFWKKV